MDRHTPHAPLYVLISLCVFGAGLFLSAGTALAITTDNAIKTYTCTIPSAGCTGWPNNDFYAARGHLVFNEVAYPGQTVVIQARVRGEKKETLSMGAATMGVSSSCPPGDGVSSGCPANDISSLLGAYPPTTVTWSTSDVTATKSLGVRSITAPLTPGTYTIGYWAYLDWPGAPNGYTSTLSYSTTTLTVLPYSFSASPNPIQVCPPDTRGATTITWTGPVGVTMQVYAGGSLFAEQVGTGSPQSQTTGDWVQDGAVFTLRTKSDGVTRASLTVHTTTSGCKPNLVAANTTPASGATFSTEQNITLAGTATNNSGVAIAQGGWHGLEIDLYSDGIDNNTGDSEPGIGGSTNFDYYIDHPRLGAFTPGQVKSTSWVWAAGDAPVGTHRYRWNVDSTDGVDESNESDNRSGWTTFVVAAPDLSSNITPTVNGALVRGGTVTFDGRVRNTGSVLVSSFSDNFTYRWGTSGGWTQLGSHINKGSLNAGATSNDLSTSFTLTQGGTFQIQHCVDSQGQVDESNESNNCQVASFTSPYACTATIPANASRWDSEEESGLSADTAWSHANSDTGAKCQYRCDAGYLWNGSSCGVILPNLVAANIAPASGSVFSTEQNITLTGTATNNSSVAITQGDWHGLEIDLYSDGIDNNTGDSEPGIGGSTNFDYYIDHPRLGAFTPGQVKSTSWVWAAGDAPVGTHRYRWNIDSTDALDESNESDNRSGWTTFVVASPDLSADINPTENGTLKQGETVTFDGRVRNTGSVPVSSFSDNFTYRWGTSGGWTQLGSHISKGSLNAGATSNDLSAPLVLANSGTLQVQHCVDSQGQITEGTEGNNCRVGNFPVEAYICTATIPANASRWDSEEESGLSADTAWSHANSDTGAKCQYRCDAGYLWNGSSCVSGASMSISASPNPISMCPPDTNGVTNITWTAPSGVAIQVYANSSLFSQGTGSGSAMTGDWVQDGAVFTLRTTADGVTRASVTVTDTLEGCGDPNLVAANTAPSTGTVFTTVDSVPFTGTVTNNGTLPVTQGGWHGLEVDLYSDGTDNNTGDSEPGGGLTTFDYYFDGALLGAFSVGQTKNLNWTSAAGFYPVGTHRYRWNVDSTNSVAESNESDNRSGWTTFVVDPPPVTDISASSNPTLRSGTLEEGQTVTFYGFGQNTGTESVSGFSNNFSYRWNGTGAWTQFGSHIPFIWTLAPDAEWSNEPSANFVLNNNGSLQIQYCVDSQGQIAESEEGNNCSVGSFTVAVPVPVYSCTGTAPTNATLCTNDSMDLTADTPRTAVNACSTPTGSSPKCEYRCSSGYVAAGNRCISGSISASPNQVASGGTSVISWNTSGTSAGGSCQVTGGSDSWSGVSGSQNSSPLSAQTTYILSCYGVALTQTTVYLLDPPTLTANPRIVKTGGGSSLSYDLHGNPSCTLTGGGLNHTLTAQTGTIPTGALFGTTEYTLSCGTVSTSVTVELREEGQET